MDTNLDGPKIVHLKEYLHHVLNDSSVGAFCKLFQQFATWPEHAIHSQHAVTSRECLSLLFLTCCCRDTHHSGLRHAAHCNMPTHTERRDKCAHHAGLLTQELAGDHPKNWRARNQTTGGRPTLVLAGTNPTTERSSYSFNPVFADKPSQSHPFVLMLFFLVAGAFGCVDALGVVRLVAQKEPRVIVVAQRVLLHYGRRPDQP